MIFKPVRIIKPFVFICFLILENIAFVSVVYSSPQTLSNDISLRNSYLYRLINRELSSRPNSAFSDNVRPISLRELSLINLQPTHQSEKTPFGGFAKIQAIEGLRFQTMYRNKAGARINNQYGEVFAGKSVAMLNLQGNATIKDALLLSYDTRVQTDFSSNQLSLYRFRFKTALTHISISYSKDSLVLGPGYFGNLFTSVNVEPQKIALIKTEIPYIIPIFGHFRWFIWHSWFDNEKEDAPDIKMLGIRLAIKPHKLLEFSLTRTSTYGGKKQKINSFSKLWGVISAKDENASTNINTDQLIGMDAALYLPFLKKLSPFIGGKLYTEYVWNDIVAFWQTEDKDNDRIFELLGRSYLYGVYLTTGKLDFRFEYLNTARPLYAHSTLGSTGSSVNGYLIGHYAGRDARAYQSELYYELSQQFHFSINMSIIKRLQRPSTNQLTKIYGFGAVYFASKKMNIELDTRYILMDHENTARSPIIYRFIERSANDWQSILSISYQL